MASRWRAVAAWSFLALVALLWSVPTTLYCWEGAYNVAQGDPPELGEVAFLLVLGLVPWAFAAAYFRSMRRRHPLTSALSFATIVLAVVTLPVLIVRAGLSGPF